MARRAVAHRSVATDWKKQFPDAPLITAYWGWENRELGDADYFRYSLPMSSSRNW